MSVFGFILGRISSHLDRIQSECGKIRTRITLNTETFHVVGELKIPGMEMLDWGNWGDHFCCGGGKNNPFNPLYNMN